MLRSLLLLGNALVMATVLLAPARVPGQELETAASAAQVVLRPGDVIHIRVWRKPELSGEFTVAADGSIGDPFYSSITVAGVLLPEVRERVRAHVARIEADPLVSIDPLFRIVVSGEVRQPSLYPVRYPTTLAQAIAQAGGATEQARLDRVQFVRDGVVQTIDLRDPASPHARMVLVSGDEILVPRRSTRLRDSLLPISALASVAALIVNIANR